MLCVLILQFVKICLLLLKHNNPTKCFIVVINLAMITLCILITVILYNQRLKNIKEKMAYQTIVREGLVIILPYYSYEPTRFFFQIFYPSIGTVIRFSGSGCGLALIFVLPCLCHYFSMQRHAEMKPAVVAIELVLVFLGCLNFVAQFLPYVMSFNM